MARSASRSCMRQAPISSTNKRAPMRDGTLPAASSRSSSQSCACWMSLTSIHLPTSTRPRCTETIVRDTRRRCVNWPRSHLTKCEQFESPFAGITRLYKGEIYCWTIMISWFYHQPLLAEVKFLAKSAGFLTTNSSICLGLWIRILWGCRLSS